MTIWIKSDGQPQKFEFCFDCENRNAIGVCDECEDGEWYEFDPTFEEEDAHV